MYVCACVCVSRGAGRGCGEGQSIAFMVKAGKLGETVAVKGWSGWVMTGVDRCG